jgi:hypothetical protein
MHGAFCVGLQAQRNQRWAPIYPRKGNRHLDARARTRRMLEYQGGATTSHLAHLEIGGNG